MFAMKLTNGINNVRNYFSAFTHSHIHEKAPKPFRLGKTSLIVKMS